MASANRKKIPSPRPPENPPPDDELEDLTAEEQRKASSRRSWLFGIGIFYSLTFPVAGYVAAFCFYDKNPGEWHLPLSLVAGSTVASVTVMVASMRAVFPKQADSDSSNLIERVARAIIDIFKASKQ